MRIKLLSHWFGPDGTLRRKGREYLVPDGWKDLVPATATVLDEPKPEPKAVETAKK